MIVRIVRMQFKPEEVENFLSVFRENMKAIRNFKGCNHLELLHDLNDRSILTTLSHWEDENDLEAYRNSELFSKVWSKVKPMFRERTNAFSMERFITTSE